MFDPTAPDSPHLEGIQPTWRDLGFVCEVLNVVWERRSYSWNEIESKLHGRAGESKIQNTVSFLKKLDLLDSEYRIHINGIWLANNFEPAPQSTISQGIQLGSKEILSDTERTIFRQLLFQYDTLPMLATIDLVSSETVSDKETEDRAVRYQERVEHLDKYDGGWSTGTWKKKAQAHFEWAKQLDLARVDQKEELELTQMGEVLDQSLSHLYHPDW